MGELIYSYSCKKKQPDGLIAERLQSKRSKQFGINLKQNMKLKYKNSVIEYDNYICLSKD